MKKTINLTVSYLLIFIFALFCAVNLILALAEQQKIKNALDIGSFHSSQIESGVFLTGTVNDYLVRPEQGLMVPISGTQGGIISPLGEFTVHAIKTSDGKYINLNIKDKYKSELLNDAQAFFNSGGISVQAKVAPNNFINFEWYKAALNVQSDEQVDNLIIDDLMIQEVNFSDNAVKIRNYALMLVLAVLLFFINGGVKGFILKSKADDEAQMM